MPNTEKLGQGVYVKHLSRRIEGRIVGKTKMKHLFEVAHDIFEYRVQTEDAIKICSPSNLEPQYSEGRVSRCYNCHLRVDPMSSECRNCGAYICADRRSCWCGVGKGVSSQPQERE